VRDVLGTGSERTTDLAPVFHERYCRFEQLLAMAQHEFDRGRTDRAATLAEVAAFHATWRHHGEFVSPELEGLIATLASSIDWSPHEPPRRTHVCRVLHVTSIIGGLAGLQHLIVRWIAADPGRRHDIAVSQPTDGVPPRLQAVVDSSGGTIELVGDLHSSPSARARRLRQLSSAVDLVVLHLQTEDLAPLIAFGLDAGPTTILVNHADHCFWPGASLVDLVANLRSAGRDLCATRRGVEPDRLWVLPTPIDDPPVKIARDAARRDLGLPPDARVLVAIARAPKFDARGGTHFADIHVPILEAHPSAELVVVGPSTDDVWDDRSARVGGRIRVMGSRSDAATFLAAADIYVDSYPMVSITSLLEAGRQGLPLASLSAHGPDAAVWSPDAPGLDGVVIACTTIEDYHERVGALIADESQRASLGARTRAHITDQHTGAGWTSSLERLYEALAALSRPAAPGSAGRALVPSRCLSEVDALTSRLMTAHTAADTYREFRGRLPTVLLIRSLSVGWPEGRRHFVVSELKRLVVEVSTRYHVIGPLRRIRRALSQWVHRVRAGSSQS
jgi:hypothetical protein